MSGTRPDGGSASESAPRPLPARPNLEFERKRAKKLLRKMRGTDANAKLADAQFAIAKEYGFSSWPKLVQYYQTLAIHEQSAAPPAWYPLEEFEKWADNILARHANGRFGVALELMAYVPRFYGKSVDHVLASTVSTDDARLIIARHNRLPSWEAMCEWVAANAESNKQGWDRYESPLMTSLQLMRAGDIDGLGRLIDAHPELLRTDPKDKRGYGSALYNALIQEFRGEPKAREIVDYLVGRGAPLEETLNWMLLHSAGRGHPASRGDGNDFIQFLLDRGADPTRTAQNGYTVLEHMLARGVQHRGRHLDLILPRVIPPKKLWVAAARGDVESRRRYFGRDGKLNAAGRKNRPDMTALGPFSAPLIPDPSDLTLLSEVFVIAMMNEQYESMAFLIEHGFPVDHPSFGWTAMWNAVNMGDVRLVEFLLEHGAKPSLKGAETPEERDEWLFYSDPTDENARRIYELCGGTNAEAVLERYRARQQTPPTMNAQLLAAIDRAREEAERLGQAEVTDDNLFLGLLRDEERRFAGWLGYYNIKLQELKATLDDRLVYGRPRPTRDIPFGTDAQASIDAAIAKRQTKHWREVNGRDLLWALAMKESGPVIELLVRHGADMAKMRESLSHD